MASNSKFLNISIQEILLKSMSCKDSTTTAEYSVVAGAMKTTDLWSDDFQKISYQSIVCRYFDANFRLQIRTLQVSFCYDSLTYSN